MCRKGSATALHLLLAIESFALEPKAESYPPPLLKCCFHDLVQLADMPPTSFPENHVFPVEDSQVEPSPSSQLQIAPAWVEFPPPWAVVAVVALAKTMVVYRWELGKDSN